MPVVPDFQAQARRQAWVIDRAPAAVLTGDDALKPRLNRITSPTLIIWGRQDALLPLHSGEKLKGGLPTANFVVMDRCGHMPPIERPEAFLRKAERFLGEEKLFRQLQDETEPVEIFTRMGPWCPRDPAIRRKVHEFWKCMLGTVAVKNPAAGEVIWRHLVQLAAHRVKP